jgi:hypothetical protein
MGASDVMRALYDVTDGGPPRGFECRLFDYPNTLVLNRPCGHVTRTERGMRMHQARVHRFVVQPLLFAEARPTVMLPMDNDFRALAPESTIPHNTLK